MAFTGELEQLHIVDVIQLIHTTRKSGTFSVRGVRGESRIIFSNGYIVGASHLNGKVRIGTVLVKMNFMTREDLERALEIQKHAGGDRKPLLATLIELGRVRHEDASKALRKLIEMTLVEMIGWTKGTFTLDTEDIVVTPECRYPIGQMEQAAVLDAQMVLMDALRVFDERERDHRSGMDVPAYEELFADVLPSSETPGATAASVLTADDLGLADLDQLERKIPPFSPAPEVFDPAEIHRQKIRETLAGFSAEEQEAFVSFLQKSTARTTSRDSSARQEGRTHALILFSEDELIKHALMTICKNEGVLVFATDGEEELDRIISQCLLIRTQPVLVFDVPGTSGGILPGEKVVSLRRSIKERYPSVSVIQMSSSHDPSFALQSYRDGVRAVFPRPSRENQQATYIHDVIASLEAFKSYLNGVFHEQKDHGAPDDRMSRLRDRLATLRDLQEPDDVPLSLLRIVAEMFERSISLVVRQAELIGERAVGVYAERESGPTSAGGLKIPLTRPSVFRDVVEKGRSYYGECDDALLKEYVFGVIDAPRSPTIILVPLRSSGKTLAVTYGDFGSKEPSRIERDLLEILAQEAGVVLEKALCHKQLAKAPTN